MNISISDTILADYEEDCVIYDKVTTTSPRGGFDVHMKAGATFKAVITPDNSFVSQIAQKQTETKQYRVTTKGNITLKQDDYIKALKKNIILRIAKDNTAKIVPSSSALSPLRSTIAEETRLPHDEI